MTPASESQRPREEMTDRPQIRTNDTAHTKMKVTQKLALAAAAAVSLFSASSAGAHDRHFAWLYEVNAMPKGQWEFEPWFTWKHYSNKDRFEFRYELETGVTDRLTMAAYLSDWRYTTGDGGDKAEWRTAGVEALYNLTNPTTDLLGSALYGEVLWGPEKFALEGKILLQKNIGPVTLAYNAVLEAEWEGEGYDEKVGVWENIFGVSYQVSPGLSFGAEALHEVEFAEWSEAGDNVVYAGPNISFAREKWYASLSGLFQVTDVDGEPESQVRLLVGFDF